MAWKYSSFIPGPKKKIQKAAIKSCSNSDVLTDNGRRARRKSIALDKSPERSHVLVDTHPVTSPATNLEC